RLARFGGRAARERYQQAHGRPAGRRRPELELAADQLRALAHAAHPESALQPVSPRTEPARIGQSLAVVGHRGVDHAVALIDAHDRLACLRVAAHIRQCLLHDPIDRALELRVQAPTLALALAEVDLDAHVQAVDRLRAPGERLQGGRQAEVVEGRRAKLGDQMAQAVDLVAEALQDGIDRLLQRLLIVDVAGVRESQAQRPHALDALVVDLPRPARALALARLHAVTQPLDLNRALG